MIRRSLVILLVFSLAAGCCLAASAPYVTGLVVDDANVPVKGATISISGRTAANKRIQTKSVRTGANGRFKSEPIPGAAMVWLSISASGCENKSVRPVKLTGRRPYDAGKIVLRRGRGVIIGTVVDTAGKPVPDVVVFNRGDAYSELRARTKADGSFKLAGFPTKAAYVFVEEPGYHIAAAYVPVPDMGTKLVLRKLDEPAPEMTLKPAVDDPQKRRELALKVARRGLEAISYDSTHNFYSNMAEKLVAADPSIASRIKRTPELDRRISFLVLNELVDTAPREVLESASEFEDWTMMHYLLLWSQRPSVRQDPALEAAFLQEAISFADRQGNFEESLSTRARAAARLLKLGVPEARAELDKAYKLAEGLGEQSQGQMLRAVVALAYATVDADKALALLPEGGGDYYGNMARLAVAREVAKTDPRKALRMLAGAGDPWSRQQLVPELAAAIAASNLDLAIGLAEGAGASEWQALALAKMAEVVAPTRPEEARELFKDGIGRLGSRGNGNGYLSSDPNLYLQLGRISSELGYPETGQLLLKALTRRQGSGMAMYSYYGYMGGFPQQRESLPVQIARLDALTARRMLQPQITMMMNDPQKRQQYFNTLAQADPEAAAEILLSLPPPKTPQQRQQRVSECYQVADALLQRPEERPELYGSPYMAFEKR